MIANDASEQFRSELLSQLPALRAFAKLRTNSRHEADDLVQATVIRALAAQHRFELDTNMRAWLFCILRNLYRSELRNRRVQLNDPIDSVPERLLQSPETQVQEIEHRELRLALRTLKPSHRDALVLVVMSGASYEEAAKICGCAVGTVKSRLNRAKASLRLALSNGPWRGDPGRAVESEFVAPGAAE